MSRQIKLVQKAVDEHLFNACMQGNVGYAEVAIAAGANINATNRGGDTPLHVAVIGNNLNAVKLLIANGADVAAKTASGANARELAHIYGLTEIAQFLERASEQQPSHAGRVTGERKDKGPPQVGG